MVRVAGGGWVRNRGGREGELGEGDGGEVN